MYNSPVQDNNSDQISHQQVESFFGRFAKVCTLNFIILVSTVLSLMNAYFDCTHDVRIPVYEPHEFLETPEATLAAPEETPVHTK